MPFQWILQCSGCRESWQTEIRDQTQFPLRCSICGLIEGWSQDTNISFILEVCGEMVKHFGPNPIEVGPKFDPEEGDEYFVVEILIPLSWVDTAPAVEERITDWVCDKPEWALMSLVATYRYIDSSALA